MVLPDNPFRSPIAVAGEAEKKRTKIPWLKGAGMGLAGWFGLIVLAGLLQEWLPVQLILLPVAPTFYLLMPLADKSPDGLATILGLSLLSGFLMHVVLWTVLLTMWRRRTRTAGGSPEGPQQTRPANLGGPCC